MLLEGLYLPLTTPFHPDGRLNAPKLAANIARYSKTPAAGLILLGPSGEPTLLDDDETCAVLRTAAEAAAPEKVLLANISRDSVHATLALAERAAALRYDALLIATPSIARTPLESTLYLQTVADRSPLPIVLLDTPSALVPQLAAHPNILALYTTTPPDMAALLAQTTAIRREATVTSTFSAVTARMLQAAAQAATRSQLVAIGGPVAVAEPPAAPPLKTRTKSIGFQVIAGAPATLLAALTAGASAIAPAFAACAPQAAYEVYAAFKDADQPLAEEKQARLTAAAEFAEALGPGGLKHGCDLNGYFGGLPRLPLLPPAGEQRAQLEALMQPMRS
jgi:dihydrodipicolinate synthase/N-acetylneuraminate lyase